MTLDLAMISQMQYQKHEYNTHTHTHNKNSTQKQINGTSARLKTFVPQMTPAKK